MTNEQVKNLKAGDNVRVYDGRIGSTIQFRVKAIRSRGKGTTEKTKAHYFAVVEPEPFPGMRRDTIVVESDEYLQALGVFPVTMVGRLYGAETYLLPNQFRDEHGTVWTVMAMSNGVAP